MRKRISVRIRKFFDRFRVRISTGIAVSLLLHVLLLTLRLGYPGLGVPGLTLPFSDKQEPAQPIKATIALQSGSPAPAPPPPPAANPVQPKPLETQSSDKPATDLPNARVKRAPAKTAQKAPRNAKALESTPALARAQRKQGSLPQEDQSAPAPASTQQHVVVAAGEHPDTFKVPPPAPDDFLRTVPRSDSTPMPPQPTPAPAPPAIALQTPKQTIEQAQEPTPAVEKPADTQSYERPDEARAKETVPPEESKDVAMEPGEKKDGEEVTDQDKVRKKDEQEAAQRAADEETRKREEERKAEEVAKQEEARKQAEKQAEVAAQQAAAKRDAEQKQQQEQQQAQQEQQRMAREAAARAAAEEQARKEADLAAKQAAEKAEAARQEAQRKQEAEKQAAEKQEVARREEERKKAEEQQREEKRKEAEQVAQKKAEEEKQKALAAEQKRQEAEAAAREKALAAERKRQEEAEAKRAQQVAQQKADADAAAQREAARAEAAAAARNNPQNGNGVASNNPGNAANGNGNGNGNGQGNGKGKGTQPSGNNTGSVISSALSQIKGLDTTLPPPSGEPDRTARNEPDQSFLPYNDVQLDAYISGWRTKIEGNGDFNYSQLKAEQVREDPVVTVWINSDGSVKHIYFNRRSGRSEIDDAVVRIINVRAPYSVFPPAMAKKYDSIPIRRIWNFGETLRLVEEAR